MSFEEAISYARKKYCQKFAQLLGVVIISTSIIRSNPLFEDMYVPPHCVIVEKMLDQDLAKDTGNPHRNVLVQA